MLAYRRRLTSFAGVMAARGGTCLPRMMLSGDGRRASAGDGWYQQHLIPVLERIARAAEEADVFFVHIDVQEAADLAGIVAEVRFQCGELFVERGEKIVQVGRGTGQLGRAAGVAAQGAGDLD